MEATQILLSLKFLKGYQLSIILINDTLIWMTRMEIKDERCLISGNLAS